MDNLKAQTHNVLTKLLQQIAKHEKEQSKNKSANPQIQSHNHTCKDLLDIYSQKLESRDKMLVEVTFMNDLAQEISTQEFKNKIKKIIAETTMDINQFNASTYEIPKATVQKAQKAIKSKKTSSNSKKTQPNVQSHPEYFRVDHQICHKLFEHYKQLPVGMPKQTTFNFEQKEHHKNSMNYHKVLEIFKDAGLSLEINQKLLILRSIKKFCFNQNFINKEEFIKVVKVIVHGLGYKEQIFEQFMKKKHFDKVDREMKKTKKSLQKPTRRNYRFKTDNSVLEYKSAINSSKNIMETSYLPDTKQLNIEIKKEGNSSKIIPQKQPLATPSSYLVKAMENQKISKITWDTLFNMKETSMHNYIVIPDIIRNVDQL